MFKVTFFKTLDEINDLLHAAPFQGLIPRPFVKGRFPLMYSFMHFHIRAFEHDDCFNKASMIHKFADEDYF